MSNKPLSEQEGEESRRDFLRIVLGGSVIAWLASVLYPVLAYMRPPRQGDVEVTSVKVGKVQEIEIGSSQIVRFGNQPVLFLRTEEGEFRAFSATCTHLDCTVQFRKDLSVIWCACHNGKFDLRGRHISGPPPRPLDEFRVLVQGDDVVVTRMT